MKKRYYVPTALNMLYKFFYHVSIVHANACVDEKAYLVYLENYTVEKYNLPYEFRANILTLKPR